MHLVQRELGLLHLVVAHATAEYGHIQGEAPECGGVEIIRPAERLELRSVPNLLVTEKTGEAWQRLGLLVLHAQFLHTGKGVDREVCSMCVPGSNACSLSAVSFASFSIVSNLSVSVIGVPCGKPRVNASSIRATSPCCWKFRCCDFACSTWIIRRSTSGLFHEPGLPHRVHFAEALSTRGCLRR